MPPVFPYKGDAGFGPRAPATRPRATPSRRPPPVNFGSPTTRLPTSALTQQQRDSRDAGRSPRPPRRSPRRPLPPTRSRTAPAPSPPDRPNQQTQRNSTYLDSRKRLYESGLPTLRLPTRLRESSSSSSSSSSSRDPFSEPFAKRDPTLEALFSLFSLSLSLSLSLAVLFAKDRDAVLREEPPPARVVARRFEARGPKSILTPFGSLEFRFQPFEGLKRRSQIEEEFNRKSRDAVNVQRCGKRFDNSGGF